MALRTATLLLDLIIAVGNDRQFASLCAVLGEPALSADARFATNPARVAHRATLIGRVTALTLQRHTAELHRALEMQ